MPERVAGPVTAPRLVATDLDGTLLRSDGTVSERTRATLLAVQERGVPVVFVTGRPLRWMDDLWPVVGDHGIAVVANGAVVYDVGARQVRRLNGIDPEAGLELLERLREALPELELATESLDGLRVVSGFDGARDGAVGPYEPAWRAPATKLLARLPGHDFAALREAVRTQVGDRAVVTWSMDGLLEISAPGVSKAAALAEVAADLGVPREHVAAFGDMPNDVSMLAWAGRSFAVAGAHPEVADVVDEVVGDNDDDGVAATLERLLGLPRGADGRGG